MIENHPEEEKVTERIQKGYKGYKEDTESKMTVTKQTNWTLASQIPSQTEISKQTKDSTHGGYFDGWRLVPGGVRDNDEEDDDGVGDDDELCSGDILNWNSCRSHSHRNTCGRLREATIERHTRAFSS